MLCCRAVEIGIVEFLIEVIRDASDSVGRMSILYADGVSCVEFCLKILRGTDVAGLSGEGSYDAVF